MCLSFDIFTLVRQYYIIELEFENCIYNMTVLDFERSEGSSGFTMVFFVLSCMQNFYQK